MRLSMTRPTSADDGDVEIAKSSGRSKHRQSASNFVASRAGVRAHCVGCGPDGVHGRIW